MSRKRVVLEKEYNLNHSRGRRLVSDDFTLTQAQNKWKFLDQWNRLIMERSADWILGLTWPTACAIDAVWRGNGSGFTPSVQCTSRNVVEFPSGWYDINYPIPICFGGVVGQGTNIATSNGNNTTYLVRDNARWVGDSTMPVMRSTNWGTSTYLESAIIDNFRIYGSGPGWLDDSYFSSGIEISTMGETCRIGTLYISDCNGHGIHIKGSGPGKVDHVSVFDNNVDGVFHESTSSLGSILFGQISGDNNGRCLYRNELAGAFEISQIKAETGLSNARGKPYKAQVPVYVKGWVAGRIGLLSSAVDPINDALIHFWSTANWSQLIVDTAVYWNSANLITNLRTNKRYYKDPYTALNFHAHSIKVRAVGTSFTLVTDEDPMTEGDFGAQERLGVVSAIGDYNFAAGTPAMDLNGP